MCDCISFLESHGLRHFPTFRYVGDVELVNELKAKYDTEFANKSSKLFNKVSILNSTRSISVNDVGLLLLEFLKGIKGGLLSCTFAKQAARILHSKHRHSVLSISFCLTP